MKNGEIREGSSIGSTASPEQDLVERSKLLGEGQTSTGCSWDKCLICMGIFGGAVGFLFLVLVTAILVAMFTLPFPRHASCSVNITFPQRCSGVRDALIHQMHMWSGMNNCESGGQKCLYEVTSVKGNIVSGTHTTPKFRFMDYITFKFGHEEGQCIVEAFSTSAFWFAWLDFGTNYCNIHNLVEGMDISNYTEQTDNTICTQYSTANCDKY
ncbi:unnamed protein product [Darwinula stevensoni]|uniref:Uncharacterized protein n=1 Tax=Darwinula stevensoni TaxID=69355 RepID=A0A7R8ZYG0_9CRUS|nr:unnamed protein product [Darwinula stevensoni]CAG0880413.1 unnamed protein product [Darwinula stevensoni]